MLRFQRRIENFICEHCGHSVTGNGYTDHCPKCLWSRHVDVNPGDRAATCKGMMEPVSIEAARKGYRIHYRCTACGEEHSNRSADDDNFEAILAIAASTGRQQR